MSELPPSRADAWQALLERIATPVVRCGLDPGLIQAMPIETAPDVSQAKRQAFSPLEALGRLMCGMAPLLEAQARGQRAGSISVQDVHRLLQGALQPPPRGLNFSHGRQPLVDAAFLAQAVLRAPTALNASLSQMLRSALVAAFKLTRRIRPHFNNWLLFSAMIEAALAQLGEDWDEMRVDLALRQIHSWYLGDGTYSDGPSFHFDYYNSFVIQPMLLDILAAVADHDPDWQRMRPQVLARAQRQAQILERLIAADGSFPPIGRSITYRCGAFHLLAQLSLLHALPGSLAPAQVRGALWATIQRTLGPSSTFSPDGWLRLGLNGVQPSLAEGYISTGSLYLCATAFLPLGLPDSDAFWANPDQPWTQLSLWSDGQEIPRDAALKG
jgi:hypothetical protein